MDKIEKNIHKNILYLSNVLIKYIGMSSFMIPDKINNKFIFYGTIDEIKSLIEFEKSTIKDQSCQQ